ncbi:DNAj-like subfamily b member 3-like protein [Chrysochromulina tobinii]|uniref:DNAj-like subfamily b member 3-like protein n=1 Tax=Chrysochromulina tobinii TaxID=1460289 RepID=A0A0M0JK37_9EUKA|nr:DNAj-like subfamily b member 3-like protein [Chrysochromulina tobinii]|eukprot:KOO26697.1 DNAj-like subfamily b member 3-like protein [Chrysochromulina sp. CCMP291]
MPTFYETLDVPTDATTDQIKKQYKKLALKWHPDKNGNSEDSQERFKKIAQAYSGADFGFLDAEAIFREFFGGRDPFETMLGGGSMLGGGGGRMSDGFGGGAFGSFGAMGAFDDFGASSGATVHVTRTYTSFSSALHSGRNSTRTSDAVSGGAVSGASRTSGGGRPSERRAVGDGGAVRPSERRVGRGGGGGGLGGVDEDEQLAADLAEAIRISRDLSLDDEERMMQAAIRASLGH